jgi:hypothetical protein
VERREHQEAQVLVDYQDLLDLVVHLVVQDHLVQQDLQEQDLILLIMPLKVE